MKKALLAVLVLLFAIHVQAAPAMNYTAPDSTKPKMTDDEKQALRDSVEAQKAADKAAREKKKADDKAAAAKKKADEKAANEKKAADEKAAKEKDKKADTGKEKKAAAKPVTRDSTAAVKSTSSTNTTSRYQLPYKTWALTVNGSFTNPYTDLKYRRFLGVSKPKNEYQWGVGLGAIHMLDGAFGIMGQLNVGALQGVADSNMDNKFDYRSMVAAGLDPSGDFFKAHFYEGSLNLYWDISNTIFGINRLLRARNSGNTAKPRWVSLYAFGGVGFNYTTTNVYHLKTGLLDTTTINGSSVFHNGSTSDLVVPVGLGLKFKLSKSLDLGIESSWHFTFTDLLDGFQYVHVDNKRRDDFYSMTGLTLTWKIGTRKRDKEHIEWRNPVESIYAEMDQLARRVDRLYKDTDGDGVSDVFDKDNNTPAGAKVYGDGTMIDTDGDGVPDIKDVEPFSDPGAKVDENGKSIDSDGDGVPDSRDLEPNTPKGALVNFQGISLDNKYAPKDIMKDINSNSRGGFYFASIYFEFNKANMDRQYEDELQSLAKTIRENEGLKIKVIGYCDPIGTVQYNDDLGMRRAKAIIDYMVRVYGFAQASFEPVSIGNRYLEKTENWVNRRVDFVVVK